MDPKLIPFGWGLFDVNDEIIVIEKGRVTFLILLIFDLIAGSVVCLLTRGNPLTRG